MSQVSQYAIHTLKEIKLFCLQFNVELYSAPCTAISGFSVGAHVRHSIEMFVMLNEMKHNEALCYDHRVRDARLENDPHFAAQMCENLLNEIGDIDFDLKLDVITPYGTQCLQSSFFRELIYCSDHATHHMALIKIACNELQFENLPENFGVAYSTQANTLSQS